METSAFDGKEKRLSVHAHAETWQVVKVIRLLVSREKSITIPATIVLGEVVASERIFVSEVSCTRRVGILEVQRSRVE